MPRTVRACRMSGYLTAGCILMFGISAMIVAGCDQNTGSSVAAPTGSGGDTSPANTAEDVLKRMAAVYENAKSYEDTGELRVNHTMSDGQKNMQGPMPFSVTLERPNKLRLHQFGAMVVIDGSDVFASINGLDDQVLTRPAPDQLTEGDIEFEPQLAEMMGGGIGVRSPIVSLLLGEDPIKEDLAASPKLLDDKKIDEDLCRRVQVATDAGTEVYWVDAKTNMLRRFEFATDAIRKKLSPDGQLADLKIRADFTGARIGNKIEETAFKFEVPQSARLVKQFLPPPPDAPAALLGQKPQSFTFVDLEGNKVTSESLQGKVVVLDVWATWCGWCFKGFPNLQKVYDQYKDNDKVAILTVNTDESSVDNEKVQKAFDDVSITLPIVRDTDKATSSVFDVQGLPTAYILGTDGTVQQIEVGFKADLAETLPKLIEDLLAGQNVAEKALREYEQKRAAYEQEAAAATVGKTTEVEIPQAKIAERSDPEHFTLTELWTNAEMKRAGNLLTIEPADGEATIYTLEPPATVLALDGNGKVTERFELKLPTVTVEGQGIPTPVSYLRTAVDGEGNRWFAAFSTTGQQAFMFDDQWQLKLSYPDKSEAGEHAGLGDFQFADLTGDGQPELLVGYLGAVGTQAASLDGKRLWSNRRVENVLKVAPWTIDEQAVVLCTNNRGTLTPIDAKGQALSDINLENRNLFHIVSHDFDSESPNELCTLSMVEDGVAMAVGINAQRQEAWEYPLPKGVHGVPIEPVVVGRLTEDGPLNWIFPGADGSIHFVSSEGKRIDSFNTGETLMGLSTTSIDGKPVLLISTSKGVSAWKVEAK